MKTNYLVILVLGLAIISSKAAEDLSDSLQARLSMDFLHKFLYEDDQNLLNLLQNIEIKDLSTSNAIGQIKVSVKPNGNHEQFNFDYEFKQPHTVIMSS